MAISSPRILDVMATIGTRSFTIRMHAVAETPSNTGIIISMKIRSYRFGSLLILDTAESPSPYHCVSHGDLLHRQVRSQKLTAVSTTQSTWFKNLAPILAHILSSSTSKILGFLLHNITSLAGGGVTCDPASSVTLGVL